MQEYAGFLNINKPQGMTSHDVVAIVKRELRQRTGQKIKVGHAGTLDPMATGVLIVCVDYATRLSEYVMASEKVYEARLRLGEVTDTYDADGEIVTRNPIDNLTCDQIAGVIPQFVGDIEQLPPMYSAVKVGGKKLYELAREGKEIERKARAVHISSIEMINCDLPECDLRITCGSGTYIRSLAFDIGEQLEVGAHLTRLERVRSGAFTVEKASTIEQLKDASNWQDVFIQPLDALSNWHQIEVDEIDADHLRHGRSIAAHEADVEHAQQGRAIAVTQQRHFLAILQLQGNVWKPHKVFHA